MTWSDEMYRLFGLPPAGAPVSGASFLAMVHPDDAERLLAFRDGVLASARVHSVTYRIRRPDGGTRLVLSRATAQDTGVSPARCLLGTAQDITRRRPDSPLWAAEEHFRVLAESAVEAIITADALGAILFWNRAASRIFGYREPEILGRPLWDLLATADAEALSSAIRDPDRAPDAPSRIGRSVEAYAVDRLGLRFPIELSLTRWEADGRPFFTAIIHDISQRRAAEEELVELYQRLVTRGEEERAHLARELHDGPVQDLYGVRLGLQQPLPEDLGAGGQAAFATAQAQLKTVADRLRAICHDLRPPALAPFGLEVAIRSHAERFQALHPELAVTLDLAPDRQRLPERTRVALYRVYQPAMANVARHAEAEQVRIRLSLDEERVTLSVRDDGRGFKVPRSWLDLARRGQLGLVGASERVKAVGGRLDVVSRPGDGTLVRVSAPLSGAAPDREPPGPAAP
jgi:PAS domain S-box-containing protein